MKKYVLKETGKEVNQGDLLVRTETIVINEETIPNLLKEGVLVVEGSDTDIDLDGDSILNHLANRIGWNRDNLKKYLENFNNINLTAVFSTLLKEIAIMMDEKYEDHISNSKEIYIINTIDGNITKLHNLSRVKNFKNFAAFRSYEEANLAKIALAPVMKELYGE